MTVTKFSSASPAAFVRADVFNIVNSVPVMGYWIVLGLNEIKLADGDYILQDDNGAIVTFVSAASYSSDLVLQALVREKVGKELTRNIWSALRSSGLSDAQKAGVATTITTVMVLIDGGEIVSGRTFAAGIATNGNFTAAVKTALLALMDTSIAKL